MLTGCYFELSRSLLHLRARGENSWAHVECWPSQHKERRAKGVCSGRTQDTGWQVLLDGCRREGTGDPLTVSCASTRIWNLIQAATGSWMHTLALCAHVCMCVSACAKPARSHPRGVKYGRFVTSLSISYRCSGYLSTSAWEAPAVNELQNPSGKMRQSEHLLHPK